MLHATFQKHMVDTIDEQVTGPNSVCKEPHREGRSTDQSVHRKQYYPNRRTLLADDKELRNRSLRLETEKEKRKACKEMKRRTRALGSAGAEERFD